MHLKNKAQLCEKLRQQIEKLVNKEMYPVESLAELIEQLNATLNQSASPEDNIAEYSAFLQQNLDWLQLIMAQLSAEKDAVAVSMNKIRQGRRAQRSYGQNN